MALHNFRKVDISKQDGKRKIIDTFINAIYVFDDHIKIIYNGNGKEETISLDELESSTLFSQGAPKIDKFRLVDFSFVSVGHNIIGRSPHHFERSENIIVRRHDTNERCCGEPQMKCFAMMLPLANDVALCANGRTRVQVLSTK